MVGDGDGSGVAYRRSAALAEIFVACKICTSASMLPPLPVHTVSLSYLSSVPPNELGIFGDESHQEGLNTRCAASESC